MKAIKYILCFSIMFVGILIIGESKIFYLDTFNEQVDSTTLYLQPNIEEEEMRKDILFSASKNNVDVFTFYKSRPNTFYTEYQVYGTKNVSDYFSDQLNIENQKYKSLFLGSVQFSFNDFKNITNIKSYNDYFLIGSKDNIHNFKMDLIDKYAGNHPIDGFKRNDIKNTIIGIWFLIISVILILAYYDVLIQKKESLIRVSLGENINRIIIKNILLDTVVYVSIFILIILILQKYTNVLFYFKISLMGLSLLVLLNALLYINLYFLNLKEVFSRSKGTKKLLTTNYVLKIITSIITITIISSNIIVVLESYNLSQQKIFFEKHKDDSFINLEYKMTTDLVMHSENTTVMEKFYQQYFDVSSPLILTSGNTNNKNLLLANENAISYLSNEIQELKNRNFTKDFYFILPKDHAIEIDDLKLHAKDFFGVTSDFSYEKIEYKNKKKIIGINYRHINTSEFIEDPIIILNNKSRSNFKGSAFDNYSNNIMYTISEDKYNHFVKENGLENQIAMKTNVLDNYLTKWESNKRVLYANSIFTILLLLLQVLIIFSILKLEYETNAIELSIKKIMGYSFYEKHWRLLAISFLTTVISITVSIIVGLLLNLNQLLPLVIGGSIILISEYFIVLFFSIKFEVNNIHKILKGGNL